MASVFSRVLHLGLLSLISLSVHAQSPADWPAPREVDHDRAAAIGIREITGKHLRLWTDALESPAVDELPHVFDAAVALWSEYFGVSYEKCQRWQVQGFLIQDRAKFAALGLLSERNPDFVNGYALDSELWFDEQPSDYYRRHLLLHEGTHSFMLSFLGDMGPGWYAEGMAELLGTHRWDGSRLELRVFPDKKESFPMWGRIKLIREAVAVNKQLSLGDVLSISNREALSVDAYAWCWAVTKFLDSHPHYSTKFRKLTSLLRESDFNERFRRLFHEEWSDLEFEWQAFVATLDYGYETKLMAVTHSKAVPIREPATLKVAADRGWQQTPWLLRGGQKYLLTAKGRFQIAHDGAPWPCEPGGVTIRYHDDHPLGMLLGALRYEDNEAGELKTVSIGLQTSLSPADDARFYLRVNDSSAKLSDNQGSLEVRIEPARDAN